MQADSGFIKDVAHTAQIGAELCCEAYALCFAAAERGRGAVEREVTQAHFVEEGEARADFAQHIARDVGSAALEFKLRQRSGHLGYRQRSELRD